MIALPSPLISIRDVVAENKIFLKSRMGKRVMTEFQRCCVGSGWNPKIVPLWNNLVVIDFCAKATHKEDPFGVERPAELLSYTICTLEDHPILAVLNLLPFLPKVVKAPYRRENRLKYLRLTDASTYLDDMNRQEMAWGTYLNNIRPHLKTATAQQLEAERIMVKNNLIKMYAIPIKYSNNPEVLDIQNDGDKHKVTAHTGTTFNPKSEHHTAMSDEPRYAIAIQQYRDAGEDYLANKCSGFVSRMGYIVAMQGRSTVVSSDFTSFDGVGQNR